MDISYKLTPTYNYYWVDSYESGRGATKNLGARGGGEGGTQQHFIWGGSARKSNPLPFYIPFLIDKGSFHVVYIDRWNFFHVLI